MENPLPLLIVGDAVSGNTGLSRITRDLSVRIHEHLGDVYRLGTAGYGTGSRQFGFPQYHLEVKDWVCVNLPEIVEDFAGNERCIVLFIWDCSRLSWFSQPERLGGETLNAYPGLARWAKKANIAKWIYCPIDASGPCNRLTAPLAFTLLGFDRILAYGQFGEDVIRRTIGDDNASQRHLTSLPHGIESSVFYEHNRMVSRAMFFQYTGAQTMFQLAGMNNTPSPDPIADDETLIAIIGTNQSRKNWPLGLETASILARNHKIRLWIHIDTLERHYSIPSLLADYGLLDKTVISLGMIPDDNMASGYSAADISFGIGPEGYGFCIAESMACGTPCITGSYANNAALVGYGMTVDPVSFYYEGSFASKRPVYNPSDWAEKAEEWIEKRTILNPRYNWNNLWKNEWEPWFWKAIK